jgi:hypothetical protein
MADGLGGGQRAVAADSGLGHLHRSLGAQQRGAGAGQAGLIGRGVNLIKLLACLHHVTLGEQALEDDAVHLGAHLGGAERRGAAGQVRGESDRLGMQRDDVNGGFWRRAGLLLLVLA